MKRLAKIGGACLNQIPMDWENNLTNIKNAISEARAEKINVLCLPELCLTGYGCEDVFLSEWLPRKSLQKLSGLLPLTQDLFLTVGLPVRYEGNVYNGIALIENGAIKGIYAKHHLAKEGVHYESRWFSSWPYNKVESIDIEGESVPIGSINHVYEDIKVGFEICEDAWQEDRPACHFPLDQVDLILNPSASHFSFDKEEYREHLVISSSEKFDCVYLYTNLLGNEAGRMIYDGDIIIAQKGELVGHNKRFSFKNHNVLGVEVDFDAHTTRRDIRDDHRSKLEEFSHAVPLALFDYCRKSRSRGFVLSLSGGADSSSIAVLIAQMVKIGIRELGLECFIQKLGIDELPYDEKGILKKILITAYQGTKNSSDTTFQSAKQLSESISATFYHWNIDEEVGGYSRKIEKVLGKELNWEDHDITLQNIQARGRSPIIWMLANLYQCILLTTSNRSEGDVGYTTMDGDTSGSVAPIAGIDKPFILQWLKYAEKELHFHGLNKVNRLQPTAELRPLEKTQTDEDDLMPYPALVAIERLAIKERCSPREVFEGLKSRYDSQQLKNWIKKFFRLWSINQWKRERIALSFHIDDFNVDPRTWCRFPILSGGFSEELQELDQL